MEKCKKVKLKTIYTLIKKSKVASEQRLTI